MTNKRGDYGSMADRVAATKANRSHSTVNRPPSNAASGPGLDYGETADYRPVEGQHVMIATGHGSSPGILIEWRKPAQLPWEGRVVHMRPDAAGRWRQVREWLPAGAITPAPTA